MLHEAQGLAVTIGLGHAKVAIDVLLQKQAARVCSERLYTGRAGNKRNVLACNSMGSLCMEQLHMHCGHLHKKLELLAEPPCLSCNQIPCLAPSALTLMLHPKTDSNISCPVVVVPHGLLLCNRASTDHWAAPYCHGAGPQDILTCTVSPLTANAHFSRLSISPNQGCRTLVALVRRCF